jgi:hypothetical protein
VPVAQVVGGIFGPGWFVRNKFARGGSFWIGGLPPGVDVATAGVFVADGVLVRVFVGVLVEV